jgi:hypothetical protein
LREPEISETWTTVELPMLRAIVHAQQQSKIPWVAAVEAVPDIDAHVSSGVAGVTGASARARCFVAPSGCRRSVAGAEGG